MILGVAKEKRKFPPLSELFSGNIIFVMELCYLHHTNNNNNRESKDMMS
jgi:hypothetical protein